MSSPSLWVLFFFISICFEAWDAADHSLFFKLQYQHSKAMFNFFYATLFTFSYDYEVSIFTWVLLGYYFSSDGYIHPCLSFIFFLAMIWYKKIKFVFSYLSILLSYLFYLFISSCIRLSCIITLCNITITFHSTELTGLDFQKCLLVSYDKETEQASILNGE